MFGIIYLLLIPFIFVITARLFLQSLKKTWPNQELDGEDFSVAALLSVIAAALWPILLPIALIVFTLGYAVKQIAKDI